MLFEEEYGVFQPQIKFFAYKPGDLQYCRIKLTASNFDAVRNNLNLIIRSVHQVTRKAMRLSNIAYVLLKESA